VIAWVFEFQLIGDDDEDDEYAEKLCKFIESYDTKQCRRLIESEVSYISLCRGSRKILHLPKSENSSP
jgi:hypothetical protein